MSAYVSVRVELSDLCMFLRGFAASYGGGKVAEDCVVAIVQGLERSGVWYTHDQSLARVESFPHAMKLQKAGHTMYACAEITGEEGDMSDILLDMQAYADRARLAVTRDAPVVCAGTQEYTN